MPDISINGVIVTFPFEPYEVQKVYMSKVLECLQNKKHGVLESPTGTGKTLCLLCSSLSWLMTKKAQLQAQALTGAIEMPNVKGEFFERLKNELESAAGSLAPSGNKKNAMCNWTSPKIIYASRTHSQLSQVMQEMKRTAYKHLKVAVIGSRDQLCIHPEVSKEQSSADKIHLCQAKVRTRSCLYYNNVELRKDDPAFSSNICDIEDLVKTGNKLKCCPYFLAKELKQNADITFMPYNYLLDAKIRRSQGIDLQNYVILLDEAHNVEKTCEESASTEISSTDVALCIDEITSVMKSISESAENKDNNEFDFDGGFGGNETQKDFTEEDLCVLKLMFLSLEQAIDAIHLSKAEGETFPGSYIFELLGKADLFPGKENLVIDKLDKIVLWLSTTSTSPFARNGRALEKFSDILRTIFTAKSVNSRSSNQGRECYKVHISTESTAKHGKSDGWNTKKIVKKSDGKIVHYWCFSSEFGMRQLIDSGVHSIILTSGTLSPLKAFISELGIPIDVQLENPHIVKRTQVCVGILNQGPDDHQLNCSYNTRNNPKYIASLGRTIYNLSCLIPDGLLIFFPSYPIMKKCRDDWQSSGLWSTISQKKSIYVEPQQKHDFNNVMNEYYNKIKEPSSRGAIFLAVCRGKVSEGLDFANANGRAVLIIGLPYPPLMDPRILLKQKYLDEVRMKDKDALTGNQWYQLEASRAVNQAIGRIIRHVNDYGAIVLCDCRFNNVNFKSQLSSWLRPYVKNFTNFGSLTKELRDFFKTINTSFPYTKPVPSINYAESEKGFAAEVKVVVSKSLSESKKLPEQETFNLNSYKSVNIDNENKNDPSSLASSSKHTINFLTSKVQGNWSKTTENKIHQVTKEIPGESVVKKRKLKVQPIDIKYDSDFSTRQLGSDVHKSVIDDSATKSTEDNGDKNKKEVGEKYLKAVKKSLSKENFKIFAQMIDVYKKRGDFDELIITLEKLFLTNTNVEYLFLGFKTFLKKQHHDKFNDYAEKIISNKC